METLVKKELYLKGLDCAHCASKIEDQTNRLEGVSASLNFMNGKLSLELENENSEEVIDAIKRIVNKLEPGVDVLDYDSHESGHRAENDNKDDKSCNDSCCGGHDAQDSHDHSHGIGHSHGEDLTHSHGDDDLNKSIKKLIASGALFLIGLISNFSIEIKLGIFLVSYLIIGSDVLLRAARNIMRGQVFDENFLMSIATIGAFIVGEYAEAVGVMLFYQVGELFQDIAVNRSRKSISDLMDIRPDYANLKVGADIKVVAPEEVKVGDLIVVKPGEKVPLDGKLIDGISTVDTSALTGESLPRDVVQGDDLLSGFININGLITIQVTKVFGESTVSKILDLVQNAGSKKAPTEKFITKFARYYTPAVVYSALAIALIPPLIIEGAVFSEWIYRALIFLVISCPCALVISIPLGFFGGIGGASKKGILIKGSNYLEALNTVDTVVFDKTGTLTKGVFNVVKIVPSEDRTEEELLETAAYAESYSTHPIGLSIIRAYKRTVDKALIDSTEEIPGHGLKVVAGGREILAGNIKLMKMEDISYDSADVDGTIVHVAVDKKYAGYIVIADELKNDSKEAIKKLKDLGIKKTIMLTGDSKGTGEKIGKELGLDKIYAELLPADKVEKFEELEANKSEKSNIIYVGDGINDAPVLARADIGIAMGGLGSDAAIEAADIVIMTDEPSKIADAFHVARKTRKIVWQNIIFALGIKGIFLIMGAFGIATMWEAVFADVGVAVIAILNSMRVK